MSSFFSPAPKVDIISLFKANLGDFRCAPKGDLAGTAAYRWAAGEAGVRIECVFYLADRVRRACNHAPHGLAPWKGREIHAALEGAARHSGDHQLRVRIARCTYDTKESLAFKWWGESDGLRELLAGLKKNKSVELLAKLDTTKATLNATSVRIERMDFELHPAVPLLPARE